MLLIYNAKALNKLLKMIRENTLNNECFCACLFFAHNGFHNKDRVETSSLSGNCSDLSFLFYDCKRKTLQVDNLICHGTNATSPFTQSQIFFLVRFRHYFVNQSQVTYNRRFSKSVKPKQFQTAYITLGTARLFLHIWFCHTLNTV